MSVDTRRVAGRRTVHYASLAELLNDAETLAAGEIRTLGNWSPGQIFSHLANTMNMSIDGAQFSVPWYVRFFAGFMKQRMLRGPMPTGFQLPPHAAQELVSPPVSTAEGLNKLRRAIGRQQQESRRAPSPVFGVMSHEEWDQLHRIHAEMHMSFLLPTSTK